jgi:RNA polymerase sigma-70 factor (ECF subfamily)
VTRNPLAAGSPAAAGSRTDSAVAAAIKAELAAGRTASARERFAELIGRHQRRASRIAYYYLRDAADADEAVQDAFIRAYTHLDTFREELPFQTWFTRILVNGCLDRLKARGRRDRWLVRLLDAGSGERDAALEFPATAPSPEQLLLATERREQLAAAVGELPERQRTVLVLSHYEGCTPREVASITGLKESTVRVHLFRAIRNLQKLLRAPDATPQGTLRRAALGSQPEPVER